MASDVGTMRGAYLLARTVNAWSHDELTGWIGRAVESGIDTVVTKVEAIAPALATLCRVSGLTLLGSLACYSDHADTVPVGDHLRPVDEHGRRWRPMEWYTGVIPTDEVYNNDLVRRCVRAAGMDGVAGIVLDFLRWPCHWELELRPGAVPRRSSFDPITLRAFGAYLARHGHVERRLDPDDPREAARLIAANLPEVWTAFRCDTIVDVAARLTAAIRSQGRLAGAFVVPADQAELADVVGQDVTRLGSLVDVVLPMTYQAILMRDVTWLQRVVDATRAATQTRVVPMLQTTADRALSGGHDWGDTIAGEQFGAALAVAGTGGYCVFPGEGLGPAQHQLLARANRLRHNAQGPIRVEANES